MFRLGSIPTSVDSLEIGIGYEAQIQQSDFYCIDPAKTKIRDQAIAVSSFGSFPSEFHIAIVDPLAEQ